MGSASTVADAPALPAVPEDRMVAEAAPAPMAAAAAAGASAAVQNALDGAMMREMLAESVRQLVATCPPDWMRTKNRPDGT